MAREVRRVPANWEHPKDEQGRHVPLYDGANFDAKRNAWDEEHAMWNEGKMRDFDGPDWIEKPAECETLEFEDYDVPRPVKADYMPVWSEDEATYYQMYSTTSEGTPVSEPKASPEELALWCHDNEVSLFAGQRGTYKQWLDISQGNESVVTLLADRESLEQTHDEWSRDDDLRGR